MGTIIDRTNEYLNLIVAAAEAVEPEPIVLPELRYTVIGLPVLDCESVIVSALNINPNFSDPRSGAASSFRCRPPQVLTVFAAISRTCNGGYDEEGFTESEEYVEASNQMAVDGDLLWEAVWGMRPFEGPGDISVGWVVEGNLWTSSIQFTIGVL